MADIIPDGANITRDTATASAPGSTRATTTAIGTMAAGGVDGGGAMTALAPGTATRTGRDSMVAPFAAVSAAFMVASTVAVSMAEASMAAVSGAIAERACWAIYAAVSENGPVTVN